MAPSLRPHLKWHLSLCVSQLCMTFGLPGSCLASVHCSLRSISETTFRKRRWNRFRGGWGSGPVYLSTHSSQWTKGLPKPRSDSETHTHSALCPVLSHSSLQGSRAGSCCTQTTPPMLGTTEGKSPSCWSGKTTGGMDVGTASHRPGLPSNSSSEENPSAGAYEQTPPTQALPSSCEGDPSRHHYSPSLVGEETGRQRGEQPACLAPGRRAWVHGQHTRPLPGVPESPCWVGPALCFGPQWSFPHVSV